MTEQEFEKAFEVETLQDWQLSAGQEIVAEEVGGAGCNTGNSTNNT